MKGEVYANLLMNAEDFNNVINGTDDNDYLGYVLSSGGDINNDGYNDIVIGVPYAEDTGSNRGQVYIFWGSETLSTSMDAENADVIINGYGDDDNFGCAISSFGDINNDGYADVVVGAYDAQDAGDDRGQVYVFYGSGSLDASINAEDANVILNGVDDSDKFGTKVALEGDLNNDGYDDLVVGATAAEDSGINRGVVYFFYGSNSLQAVIDAENADVIINGTSDSDYLSAGISSAGDINRDGYNDVLVGAFRAEDTGVDRGRSYIFYGSDAIPSAIDAENADVILNGERDSDFFGAEVSIMGDVNRDGFYDILIGAYTAEDFGSDRGKVYIFYGSNSLASSIDAENADIIINGTSDGDRFGYSGSLIEDVNNDEYDDILVGAYTAEDEGSSRGIVYIIFGSSKISSMIDAEKSDVILFGTNDGDFFGWDVFSADNSGIDGYSDIVVGAMGAEDVGSSRGRVYIFDLNYGSLFISIDEIRDLIITSTQVEGTASKTGANILGVEIRLDGGEWITCNATDGAFDEEEEEFYCDISGLSEGEHLIEARFYDENRVYIPQSIYARETFSVVLPGTGSEVLVFEIVGILMLVSFLIRNKFSIILRC